MNTIFTRVVDARIVPSETTTSFSPMNYLPRGHMYYVNSLSIPINTNQYPNLQPGIVSLDFVWNYPTSVVGTYNDNRFPHGFNLVLPSSRSLQGQSGVYIAPDNQELYIDILSIVVEVTNVESLSTPLSVPIILSHSGSPYCTIQSVKSLFSMATNVGVYQSVANPKCTTFVFDIKSVPPGRFANPDYFHIYVNNHSFINEDFITSFLIGFRCWETT